MRSCEPRLNPTRREPPAEGVVVDSYRLCRQVGSGGLSWVYMAERLSGGPLVALKFLRGALVNLPGFVRRFEREAQVCRRLDHPRCVRLFDHGLAGGIPYLVMELVDGITLAELIHRGAVAPQRAIGITRQICAALAHAHGRSVVHRDLKPGNIMLTADDRVKVVDFGTSVILGGANPAIGGADIGTPSYMAPEQLTGKSGSPQTDLYALGVILFELLSGQRPYAAQSARRVLQMQVSSPIPSPRALRPELGLSPELEGVIVRAMQKAPENRFVDAASFDAALGAVPEVCRQRELRRAHPATAVSSQPRRPSVPPESESATPSGEARDHRGKPAKGAALVGC